ncbi:Holliday junction resolvase RuvX [Buchnera aphidicola]|uniref:Holliday junction resolvase RuvX n=1 Tax=Buchnera aphidicola TaxID=9 RepID=UPI0020938BCF|nr:Holliday junction resolvase RuvX [Buchnera aphidicola]USS94102.1 Holliday junction resolvase RuvX [Buchnera aphidicola (Sipha maydis)]WII23649.1 Holliday junction resolvase RuvX [Buchnera aphidicola (Sipha maydis)]
MILLAFDYGTKNIGVAIGESFIQTSRTLDCISRKKNNHWLKIKKIISEWEPLKIILGLPLNIHGKNQKTTLKTRKFSMKLFKKFHIPIHLQDERFTTQEAKSVLFNKYGKKKLNVKNINSTSALIILRSWLYQNTYKNKK